MEFEILDVEYSRKDKKILLKLTVENAFFQTEVGYKKCLESWECVSYFGLSKDREYFYKENVIERILHHPKVRLYTLF